MKFKKGQKNEVMPAVGKLVDAAFYGEGNYSHVLYMIPVVMRERIDDFRESKPDAVGHPAYCSIEPEGKASIIDVWPAPNRPMEIRVRYYPPMEEV